MLDGSRTAQTTWYPALANASARRLPMKPLAPVIKIIRSRPFRDDQELFSGSSITSETNVPLATRFQVLKIHSLQSVHNNPREKYENMVSITSGWRHIG
jgi:hypothetical protein